MRIKGFLISLLIALIAISLFLSIFIFFQGQENKIIYSDYIEEMIFSGNSVKLVLSESILDVFVTGDGLLVVFILEDGRETGIKVPKSTEPFNFKLNSVGIKSVKEIRKVELRFLGDLQLESIETSSGESLEIYNFESDIYSGKKSGSSKSSSSTSSSVTDDDFEEESPDNESQPAETEEENDEETESEKENNVDEDLTIICTDTCESKGYTCGIRVICEEVVDCGECFPQEKDSEDFIEIANADIYVDYLVSDCESYDIISRSCGSGTNKAYNTISGGVNALVAGQTLMIRGGNYFEEVEISSIRGNSNKITTIQNYPNENPVLIGWKEIPLSEFSKCSEVQCNELLNVNNLGINNQNLDKIYRIELSDTDGFFVFEGNSYYDVARWPEQSDKFFMSWEEFKPINFQETPKGTKTFIADSDFSKILGISKDGLWNGARITVWLHDLNSNSETKTISNFIAKENKAILSSSLSVGISEGTLPDAFSIHNHPLLLDKPGEYYLGSRLSNGRYPLYIVPFNNNPNSKIAVPDLNRGIRISNSDYVIIEGLDIKGYASSSTATGGIIQNSDGGANNIIIRENKIHHTSGYAGIDFRGGKGNIIENNHIYMIKSGHPIRMANLVEGVVRGNIIINTSASTGIRFQGVNKGVIFNNSISGSTQNHGQAISVYLGSSNVHIANNHLLDPLTFNPGSNFSVINNIIDANYRNSVVPWGTNEVNYPYYLGDFVFFNNLITSQDPDTGKALQTASTDIVNPLIVKNNIIDGFLLINERGDIHTHNIYTEASYLQSLKYGWKTGISEVFATNKHSEILNSYYTQDYRLKEGSIAIDSGENIINSLPDFLDDPFFSEYKDLVYLDIDGTPRDSNWDIGPYEFSSVQMSAQSGVIDSVELTEEGFFSNVATFIVGIFREKESEELSQEDISEDFEEELEIVEEPEFIEEEVIEELTSGDVAEENLTNKVNDSYENLDLENKSETEGDLIEEVKSSEEAFLDYIFFKSGKLYSGNSYDSYVSPLDIDSEFSVSLFVNPESENKYFHLIRVGKYIYPFSLDLTGNGEKNWVKAGVRTLESGTTYVVSKDSISKGENGHVVLTFSEGKLIIYINGIKSAEQKISGNLGIPSVPEKIYIGGNLGSEYYFNGNIDDIRIYKRKLNENEISSIYCSKIDCNKNLITGFFSRIVH